MKTEFKCSRCGKTKVKDLFLNRMGNGSFWYVYTPHDWSIVEDELVCKKCCKEIKAKIKEFMKG